MLSSMWATAGVASVAVGNAADLLDRVDLPRPDLRSHLALAYLAEDHRAVAGGLSEAEVHEVDQPLGELLLDCQLGLDGLLDRPVDHAAPFYRQGKAGARVVEEELQPRGPGQAQGFHVVEGDDARHALCSSPDGRARPAVAA